MSPDFAVGAAAERDAVGARCIWDAEITYELQVEVLLLLRRLAEHFAAAAMSVTQSRAFDAVCVVVPGCLAALADVVMRRRAAREPSAACVHLMGQTLRGRQLGVAGFGVGVDNFVRQAETMEPVVILQRAFLD